MLLMKHDSFDEQIEQACYNPSAIHLPLEWKMICLKQNDTQSKIR